MKPLMQPLPQLLLIVLFLLIGCKDKDLIMERPGGGAQQPVPPASTKVVLTLDALPGETNIVNELFALISISNEKDQPVVLNQKMALQHDGKYVTDTITLTSGQYKINKFLIVDKSGFTKFATPLTGSEMGGQVQHPLAISFTLPKPTVSAIAIDVLRIAPGAQPEKYGYPAGAFNLPATQEPDETEIPDPNPFIKIKVRPLIKIGDVVYDSIPVNFILTSWNAAGQPTVVHLNLPAGTNEVSLPKSAVRYDLLVSKWGTTDELSLQKEDVNEGAIYTLGGSKAAKKLKSELGFKMVKGAWVAETKNVYEYDGAGRLMKVLYHRKRTDNTPYIHATEYLDYNNMGKVEKIVKKDESNQLLSETTFQYAADGKIINMLQKQGSLQTVANVSYHSRPGSTGISGNYNINVRYQYSNTQVTGQYNMQLKGGNKD